MAEKNSEKNDYFEYVSTVLGVKSVYMEPQTTATVTKESVPLLVTVQELSQYSAEEKDLLEKMISALKIDLNKIKVCDVSQAADTDFEFLISFMDQPIQDFAAENVLTTYSPRVLLKNPSLKKQVWNEFQSVIKFFSN